MMRLLFCAILFSACSTAFGQKKISVNLLYRPEVTSYRDSISFRWKEKTPRRTLSSFGFRVLPQYRFNSQFFVSAGIGFVDRIFRNNVFFDQARVGDSLQYLLTSKRVEYRIIEFPLAVGYSVYSKNKIEINVSAEMSYNYLLSAYYRPQVHEGTYKKNYWIGKSFSGLLSANYKIISKLDLTLKAGYSFINETKKDIFLFSQDEYGIEIEHKYIPIMVGLKYNFR